MTKEKKKKKRKTGTVVGSENMLQEWKHKRFKTELNC